MISEKITAYGHVNVHALHKTTFEITGEHHLTHRGDCIVAVSADRGLGDLSNEFKSELLAGKKLRITFECDGVTEVVHAFGHPKLTFENPYELVVRKSDFVCNRTLAVRADKAAVDFDRKLVEKLAQELDVNVVLEVLP